MDYLPTLLKIIEGGVTENSERVAAYARVLIDKLQSQGDEKSANKVLKILQQESTHRGLSPAGGLVSPQIPVDKDSRFNLADETYPSIEAALIQLESMAEKEVCEFIAFVKNSHRLIDAGVGISPTMLIYGPPGCGKSRLAENVAARLELPLLTARCDSLMSSLLGSTAKNIRALFEHASNRPCVLFLDEFDALAKARDDQHEVGELKRVVVSLLQNIDNLPPDTVVIAATNHESLLDPAVWRRFAYRLHLHLPSAEIREKLLRQFLGSYCPKNLKNYISATDGMSGALIKQACESIIRHAILNDFHEFEDNELLAKIAQVQYSSILQSLDSTEEKIKKLKASNSRLFTTRLLSDLFEVSAGKVSKIINSTS